MRDNKVFEGSVVLAQVPEWRTSITWMAAGRRLLDDLYGPSLRPGDSGASLSDAGRSRVCAGGYTSLVVSGC